MLYEVITLEHLVTRQTNGVHPLLNNFRPARVNRPAARGVNQLPQAAVGVEMTAQHPLLVGALGDP